MAFNVRLFGYIGIIQVGEPRAQQFSGGSVFLNEEPCLWSQRLVCDGSTIVTSAPITTIPDNTQMICVEVPDGHEIRYEVVQPGAVMRTVSSSSRRGSGSFNLAWNPGYTLSIIDAVVTAASGIVAAYPPGIIGWWDTSILSSLTLAGGLCSAIADQSGNGNNMASVTTTTTYSATGFNASYPALIFEVATRAGYFSHPGFALSGSELTAWYVGTFVDIGNHFSNFGRAMGYAKVGALDFDNAGSFSFNRGNSNALIEYARNAVGFFPPATMTSPHRAILTVDSSDVPTIYFNGVAAVGPAVAGDWVTGGAMMLGSNGSAAHEGYWNGPISEWGATNAFSNAGVVAALDLALKNKWGL